MEWKWDQINAYINPSNDFYSQESFSLDPQKRFGSGKDLVERCEPTGSGKV